jgi:hypothetical protein
MCEYPNYGHKKSCLMHRNIYIISMAYRCFRSKTSRCNNSKRSCRGSTDIGKSIIYFVNRNNNFLTINGNNFVCLKAYSLRKFKKSTLTKEF